MRSNFNGDLHENFIFRHFDKIFAVMFASVLVFIIAVIAFDGYIAIRAVSEINKECADSEKVSECVGKVIGNVKKGIESVER